MQWIWFALGQIVNVLRQANLVAASRGEKNPVNKWWQWIYRNLVGLLVREIFAIGLWMFLVHPSFGPAALAHWKPEYGRYGTIFIEIPFLAAPFGVMFSILFDYVLERFTWLKAHIPALGNGANGTT